MDAINILRGHDLFGLFLPEQVEKISTFCGSRTLEKGDVIYQPDRKPTHFFVLLEGQVHLRLPARTGETGMLISQVRKGEFFGIAPLLGSDRYTTRAQCAEASRVLFIEAKPFLEMLDANPVIGQRIMTVVARAYFDRYMQIVERIQKVLTDLALG